MAYKKEIYTCNLEIVVNLQTVSGYLRLKSDKSWTIYFDFILGTNNSSNQSKNGTPFPRACPKCNIHFNLLDPLKNHMKVKLSKFDFEKVCKSLKMLIYSN